MTKLNPRLPQGEANGLDDLSAKLVSDPQRKRVLIAVVDCSRVILDPDTGDREPVVRFRRVELLGAQDAAQGETLMRRAMERRSGRTTLPFEVEDELSRMFADVAAEDEYRENTDGGAS